MATTINAREKVKIRVPESQCLVVTSVANSSGTAYRQGTSANPANTTATFPIAAGANFIIPPVQGGAEYLVVCDAGSITLTDVNYAATFVVSSAASSDADGRPDGTIYFQGP